MSKRWLRNSFIISIIFVGKISFSQLQSDTLKEFLKEEVITQLNTFSNVSLLDSNKQFLGLNEVLESSSAVYVKNYGKGQLATLSIRGNGASQTQLFWNGFKMNSPTLGQSDLSLIPLFFLSEANLNYSGASSMGGSGGIGGSIQLNNKLEWKKGIHGAVLQDFASFTNSSSGVNLSYGGKRLYHNLKLLHNKGLNDFEFVDISKQNNPFKTQENNELNQFGAQYEFGFQLNKKNLIYSTLFYFDSYRELPPIIGGVSNMESQSDKNLKSFVSWKSFQDKYKSDFRVSYLQESLNYTDSISAIYSDVKVKTYQGQYRFNFDILKKIKIETSLQSAYSEVTSNGFESNKSRNESGIYVKASQKFKKFNYDLFVRQEMIDNKVSPTIFGAGLFFKPFKKSIVFKGNISTNYRVPTLNDLYWNPGGNEDLNPEKGWTTELGAEYENNSKKWGYRYRKGYFNYERKLNIGLTGFFNHTNNWIQWQPTIFGYWEPVNLKSIENKGLEASVKYKYSNNKSKRKYNINLFYTYTDSKNLSFTSGREEIINKQTVYVPKHKLTLFLSCSFKKLTLTYSQLYNSRVFIDESNFSYLPHYFPANIGVNYRFKIKNIKSGIGFRIINLYNEQYHVTANRPIPGRNYSLSLKINF
ncbi:TonB-dependent receptor [Flavobacteriales bacterium]|nr:TonB-dependent receptor [Flavobacteriales bacterium]